MLPFANLSHDAENEYFSDGLAEEIRNQLARVRGLRVAAARARDTRFDAYDLYLLGRHHFHKRTEAALRRAMDCFRQAIDYDPAYALAYSGLADAYTLASNGYYGDLPAEESIANALPATMKALELAPMLAEAHASLGLVRHNQGDHAAAERAFSRAIELNPNYTMAHVWHGLALISQGRYREAAAHMRDAFRLDPLSPIINANVGFDALRFGAYAEAEARFAAAIEIDPAFQVPYSGMARLNTGRGSLEEALRWIEHAIERAPGRAFYVSRKGLILAQLDRTDAAVAAVEAASRGPSGNRFEADLVVGLRVATGDERGRGVLHELVARADSPPSVRGNGWRNTSHGTPAECREWLAVVTP